MGWRLQKLMQKKKRTNVMQLNTRDPKKVRLDASSLAFSADLPFKNLQCHAKDCQTTNFTSLFMEEQIQK